MTGYQWAVLILGVLGFAVTWTGAVIGATKAIEVIKRDTSQKIAEEVLARTQALAKAVEDRNKEMDELRREWADGQKAQDQHFGEMGAALRRFIETVEKEMHDIELWGRDHYVQKTDFEKSMDSIKVAIKDMGADIKADVRERIDDLSKRFNK